MVQAQAGSVFDGLPDAEVAAILEPLERRRFRAGETVIQEGDVRHALYVILAGTADAFITTASGAEHRVNSVGAGAALGEMSLFTGQPASATVRATSDLEVAVMDEPTFHHTASSRPRIYQNLGAILARRLVRTERRALVEQEGRVALLADHGAPPDLAYALAASVAWHARQPTLLLVVVVEGATTPPSSLVAVEPLDEALHAPRADGRAQVHVAVVRPEAYASALARARRTFQQVLVVVPPGAVEPSGDEVARTHGRVLDLRAAQDGADTWQDGVGDGLAVVRAWCSPPAVPPSARERTTLDVPPLSPGDERALHQGALPLGTPAGDALGRAARHLAGFTVGVAFGAGSVKGYAHVGVLRVFQRVGLPIDIVAGTSVGAAVGALYATGGDSEQVAASLDRVGASLFRPTLSPTCILSNAGVRSEIKALAGEQRIEDLPLPLAIVAADITTQREVVFRRGLLWSALLASISIPGVYPPVRLGRYTLVDGGVLDPVPSDVVAEMGADVTIAVRLRNRAFQREEAEAAVPEGRAPSMLETLTHTLDIMESRIASRAVGGEAILVTPLFRVGPGWGLRKFSQGRAFIEYGEQAAEEALPRLAAALPWLRR